MATVPPIDPYVRLAYEDAYKISGRDMTILRDALRYKQRAESLEREQVSLRQIIAKYQERFGEL